MLNFDNYACDLIVNRRRQRKGEPSIAPLRYIKFPKTNSVNQIVKIFLQLYLSTPFVLEMLDRRTKPACP